MVPHVFGRQASRVSRTSHLQRPAREVGGAAVMKVEVSQLREVADTER